MAWCLLGIKLFLQENASETGVSKSATILFRLQCAVYAKVKHHKRIRSPFNTLRPRQIGCHFADNIFKCIFLIENVRIPIKISLNFVSKGPINNIPSLVQIMAWRRPGSKPLYEPMIISLLMHICITQPQWVKSKDHHFKYKDTHYKAKMWDCLIFLMGICFLVTMYLHEAIVQKNC